MIDFSGIGLFIIIAAAIALATGVFLGLGCEWLYHHLSVNVSIK